MNFLKKKNAFTLVEVLIATVILSISLVVLYSSFQVGLAGFRRTESNLTEEWEGRVFVKTLARELRNSLPYSKYPFHGETSFISFPAAFSRYTPKGIVNGFYLVEYKVKEGSLLRIEKRLKRESLLDKTKTEETLFERLKTCRFEFLSLGDNKKLVWRKDWFNQPYVGLPRGVRITISGNVFGKEEQSFEVLMPHGVLLSDSSQTLAPDTSKFSFPPCKGIGENENLPKTVGNKIKTF